MLFAFCVFWYNMPNVMCNGINGEFDVSLRLLRTTITHQKSVVNAWTEEGTKDEI